MSNAAPETDVFAKRYAAALAVYAASEEPGDDLSDAFALGREAIESGLGILDLCSIHADAVVPILTSGRHDSLTATARASEFLTEGLASFDMVHRGFRETNAAIQALNRELERKLDELRQLAAIVEATDDAVYAASLDGTVLSWNPAAERLYGYTAMEAVGTSDELLAAPSHRDELSTIRELLDRGESVTQLETVRLRKEGGPVDVSLTVSPIRDDQGAVVAAAVIARDISERKRAQEEQAKLEQQLRQAQKMEAIGRLAGGIAHDFNNLLMVVQLSAAQVGKHQTEPSREADLRQIDEAVQRGTALTRQLLAFSRQQVLRPEPTDVNAVVRDTLTLLERLIGEDIELVFELAPDVGAIIVDPGQLGQVLLNLAVNARDAMPGGGTLAIRTSMLQLDEPYSREHLDVTPGSYALIQVTDNGIGMDEATRARAFDPFFTTKEYGTGFGLATVYGIVNQSGGHTWLYSEPGKGTTFKIYLPVALEPEPTLSPPPSHTTSLDGIESILLVEDDDALRALVALTLKEYGYPVIEASTPTEALEIAQGSISIDLLLTDVVMPKMNGRELAEALLASRPMLKVLFTSGYPADTVVRHGIADGTVSYIEKPYLPVDLARKLREMLDAPQP